MFGALKRGFRSMASLMLVRSVVGELQPKRTLAASRGFLAAARLSCKEEDLLFDTANSPQYSNSLTVNTLVNTAMLAPLIRLQHMVLHKGVLIVCLLD